MNIFCALILMLVASSVSAKGRSLSKNAQSVAQTQENIPEEPPVRRLKNGKKVVKLQPDEVLDGSSEYNRQDKTISATWEMFGLVDYFVTGWSLGYYMTPDSIIELNVVSETDRSERRLTTLRLKSFWGNSFYTNLGLGQRTRSYTDYPSVYESTNDDYRYVSYQRKVLGVDFAIGNRWQWEYFTLGCDWIGVFSPLSETGTNKISDDGGLTRKEAEAVANENSDDYPSVQVLRFYIGMSF